jgi:hypothetical protein
MSTGPAVEIPDFTLGDFERGVPERLLDAVDENRGLILWPHGHEKLGARVGHYLYTQRPDLLPHVDYICGNPLAAAMNEQDTSSVETPGYEGKGTDLNRGFLPGTIPRSYEEHRAQEIMALISERNYRWILDLHTTTTDSDRFLIISEKFIDGPVAQSIIAAAPMPRIARWPEYVELPSGERDPLALKGLIGNFPQSASVECDHKLVDSVGVPEVVLLIEGLVRGVPQVQAQRRQIFDVTGYIPKDDQLGADARNFYPTPEGLYPVLNGDNRYRADETKPYKGFYATSVTEAII